MMEPPYPKKGQHKKGGEGATQAHSANRRSRTALEEGESLVRVSV